MQHTEHSKGIIKEIVSKANNKNFKKVLQKYDHKDQVESIFRNSFIKASASSF